MLYSSKRMNIYENVSSILSSIQQIIYNTTQE